MTAKKSDFEISCGDEALPSVRTRWNDRMDEAGIRGEFKFFFAAPFAAKTIVYGDDYPYLGIFEHNVERHEKMRAMSFSTKPRDWAEQNGIAYNLHITTKHHSCIVHRGRETLVSEGDCVLLDMKEETTFLNPGGSYRCASIYIPEKTIKNWLPHPEDACGKLLSKKSDWGKALSATMQALTNQDNLDKMALSQGAVTDHICCLLALMLSDSTTPAISGYRASVFMRLLRTMRDNFCDPQFSIADLATRHSIREPTLYAIFAAAGTTFRTELIKLRLDQAKQLLGDRRFDGKAIAEIALQTGFVNAGHFATLFRKSFGVSPKAYRSISRT